MAAAAAAAFSLQAATWRGVASPPGLVACDMMSQDRGNFCDAEADAANQHGSGSSSSKHQARVGC